MTKAAVALQDAKNWLVDRSAGHVKTLRFELWRFADETLLAEGDLHPLANGLLGSSDGVYASNLGFGGPLEPASTAPAKAIIFCRSDAATAAMNGRTLVIIYRPTGTQTYELVWNYDGTYFIDDRSVAGNEFVLILTQITTGV